ncbi:MAG: YgiT-type zinc finger protein [Phycisphaerae bacterium]
MRRVYCQGQMKRRPVSMHVDRGSCHLTLDDVPAWVCQQCGEPYFEGTEVDAFQDLLKTIEKKSKLLRSAG